jgi:signal transduction histidine kinase/ligand-binding sensor domain-containing protein
MKPELTCFASYKNIWCRVIYPLRLIPIGLLWFSCFSGYQVAAHYRVDHWTTDNGLPQNTIRGLVQTRDGYLWFTTFDGLVRFDGVHFTVFDRNNTPGIVNNRFTRINEDKNGTLYAAMEAGGITIYRNGIFTSYTQVNGFPGTTAFELIPDPQGEMLIKTGMNASYYFRDGKFILAPPEYQSNHEKNIYCSPSGKFWTFDWKGIYRHTDGYVLHYPFPFKSLNMEMHVILYEDQTGKLWINNQTGKLYQLQNGTVTSFGEKDGLPQGTFTRSYCQDYDGGIWSIAGDVRSQHNKLIRFKDGRFTVFGKESGMPETDIGQIITDQEGTIWAGTSTGLYRIRKQLITTYSTQQGLTGKEVYPLLQTRNNDILAGTTLSLSRFRNGRFSPVLSLPQLAFAQALWEEPGGRLWVGHIGGLSWYENGKLTEPYPTRFATVLAIRPDRAGNVWVASETYGLFKFKGDKIIANYTTADGLPGNDVKDIHESPDGTLWFATYGGLVALKDGRFTAWTTKDGLASDHVRSIYEDADGVLWIGTYDGGLSRFRDGKFFNYTIDNGLFNNGVFCILEDRRHNFWMSSNRGIYRVNRLELNDFADGKLAQINCLAYGKSDGMLNTECNGGRQPAGIIDADGTMWFSTQDGVAVIAPDAVTTNPFAPPVEIESVTIDRKPTTMETLQSAIHNPQSAIILNPSQISLDITYTALSLVKSDLIRFRYKMEGLDKDWVEAGMRRTAYYAYIPPGEYTFRVIAANSDGVWNTQGKAIKIIIIPPFYRRWWFIVLVIVVTLGLMFLIYGYRISQLERERTAQQAFSQQLIASQEDERKRIAGELHDSLGQTLLIIKNRAYMGAKTVDSIEVAPDVAREQFDEISDSASEAINQVREISYYLRPSQLERLGLTIAIEEMLQQVAESSSIRFDFEISQLDGAFSPESEINFYRIVQECANNIIKHSGATQAEVCISRDDQVVELIVHDNGKGFDPNALQTNGASKSGFGLTGIAERVRILGGKYAIESVPESGTTVEVRIDKKSEVKKYEKGET